MHSHVHGYRTEKSTMGALTLKGIVQDTPLKVGSRSNISVHHPLHSILLCSEEKNQIPVAAKA